MPVRIAIFAVIALITVTSWGAPVLGIASGEQMAFDAFGSGITMTGPGTYDVTIECAGENGGLITSSGFRRWWGAEISGLAGGETLNVEVTNLGFSDTILPVWALSTDGGTSFTDDARMPTSATPSVSGPSGVYTDSFTLNIPAGTTDVRLWKYFPYTIADRDAFLSSLPAVNPAGPVRFNGSIGLSTEGRDIMMIELSNGSDDTGKRRIWIHAAIHSAETTSYFVVEGLVDFLLNSGTPEAQNLLDSCILDIVPMLNVDGVARGNYRASAPNPPTDPLGADMESRYNDSGLGVSDFAECQVVFDQIASYNGIPPAAPTANPVEVVLNLHASHGNSWPFHFQHVGTYPPSGVIADVNALEQDWIDAFRAASPLFVDFGSTNFSTLGSRGYIEATMHDLYSNNPSYTGPMIMAITYEGSYQGGEGGTQWNTPDDYRENGVDMARALLDYFSLPAPVELSGFNAR